MLIFDINVYRINKKEPNGSTNISRRNFRSSMGKIINADIQGALNIIKKAIPKAFPKGKADRIEDDGLHPIRVNPLNTNRNVSFV
jgi:transposase